jgi:hypothetical protein
MDLTKIPFLQARNYTPVSSRVISLLCLHTMEAPEKPATAKAVAQWFAGSTAPRASAHYNTDDKEIWQSVKEKDVAWAAPGANKQGIHLEHAGYARQSAAEWADPYSEAMLRLSARLAADICRRHDLPVVFVPAEGLLRGERGITTHAAVSKAWRQTSHTDPGPGFPMAHYLNLVREAMAPKEIAPMYEPALTLEPIVADLACPTGGAWLLAGAGAIYNFGGAPFLGGWNGWTNIVGKPARLLASDSPEIPAEWNPGVRPAGKYVMQTTTGHIYTP